MTLTTEKPTIVACSERAAAELAPEMREYLLPGVTPLPARLAMSAASHALLEPLMRPGRGHWNRTLDCRDYDVSSLSPEQLEAFVAEGWDLRAFYAVDHASAVSRARAVAARLPQSRVVDGFLASLSDRRRQAPGAGALMDWVQASRLPEHDFQGAGKRPDVCATCGHAPAVQVVHLAGGVVAAHCLLLGTPGSCSNPLALATSLEGFETQPVRKPTDADFVAFRAYLDVLAELPPSATESVLR
jgi:hypothetical protein